MTVQGFQNQICSSCTGLMVVVKLLHWVCRRTFISISNLRLCFITKRIMKEHTYYVLWKKLSVPKAIDWVGLKNVQLFFFLSAKTKAQSLSEPQKDIFRRTADQLIYVN